MKMLRRVLILLAVALLLPLSAQATDTNLTLLHEVDGETFADARYDLYLLDRDYDDALAAYNAVIKAGKAPDHTVVTNRDGEASIPALKAGTYLLVGHAHRISETKYCMGEKNLLTFPYRDENGDPIYDLTMTTKPDLKDADEVTEFEVIKIWKDKSNTKKRPKNVKVELYRNQKLHETILLTKDENWRYSWTDEDPSAVWTVVEKVPSGYKEKYTREGNTFTITNTLKSTQPTESGDKLPQTGQLWWPVPVLALAGVLLLLMGWIRRKESRDEA